MLDPRIRAKRLRAEHARVRALHDRGALIRVVEALGDPPDRYLIDYSCRGIARVMGDMPIYSDRHQVSLVLTSTFPTEQPQIEWLTPIFHPNISPNGESVCIGRWYPAKTLDELLIMLGEMIQYKNYASHDPLSLEASLWVMAHKDLLPTDTRSLLEPDGPGASSEHAPAAEDSVDIVILGR